MKRVYKGMETTYINGYEDFINEENRILVEEDEVENANHIVMLMNSERSFGLLCATRPTETLSGNKSRMEKLQRDVIKLKCSYIPFKFGFNIASEGGSTIRKEENYLFISGIELEELLELAAKYEQPTVAFGSKGEIKSYDVQSGKPIVMLGAVDAKLAMAEILFNPGAFR